MCFKGNLIGFGRVCNVGRVPRVRSLPKGIAWLRTRQRLRVIIRPSLLSSAFWRKDRGSTWEMKGDQWQSETQERKYLRTLIFVPFSGFQFPTLRSVATIVFARRWPNVSSMSSVGFGPCVWQAVEQSNHQGRATRTYGDGFYILVRPLTSPPPSFRTRQPQVDGPGSIIDPRNEHKLG